MTSQLTVPLQRIRWSRESTVLRIELLTPQRHAVVVHKGRRGVAIMDPSAWAWKSRL